MKTENIACLVGIALQMCVVINMWRLKRNWGLNPTGWWLFAVFCLLALLHTAQAIQILQSPANAAPGLEWMYPLASFLILIVTVHLQLQFKQLHGIHEIELAMREKLEEEVRKKTEYLTRSIEALEAEIAERKRLEAEANDFTLILKSMNRTATFRK